MRERDQHRLVEKMSQLDPLVLERKPRVRADHGEVKITGLEARELAGRGALDQRRRDVGVPGAKGRERPRHELGVGRRESAHAKLPGLEPAERRDLTTSCAQTVEDGLRVREERAACVGQPHAAAGQPVEQRRADVVLERGDLAGDGRLGVLERLAGGGERAAGGDLPERKQQRGIHAQNAC